MIRYGNNSAHVVTWVMAAGSKFAFKIAAKPLQLETWLLGYRYRI